MTGFATLDDAVAAAREQASIKDHLWRIYKDRHNRFHPLREQGSWGCGDLITCCLEEVYWINSYGAGGPSHLSFRRRQYLNEHRGIPSRQSKFGNNPWLGYGYRSKT